GFSLVEVYPKTGRTHQIRIHMASIGHPVVGDKLYGSRSPFGRSPVGRHFLHAFYLSFSLPAGKKLALEADLPEDLCAFLTKLEK
ncbi:RluA family pseudouridine synthase, partial [Patescibacteria group bacterium]|nr:RluA family pseudouridine synthase [Patescibacteria group bacterium]